MPGFGFGVAEGGFGDIAGGVAAPRGEGGVAPAVGGGRGVGGAGGGIGGERVGDGGIPTLAVVGLDVVGGADAGAGERLRKG